MEYKKVRQEIFNLVNENLQKLAELFPSAVKDGELDIDALKEELGEFKEVEKEKFELTWAGKQDAKKKAQEVILGKTLKYIPEDSKNPDTTKNLYIEGDNLEVLKLLRENYYNSIKMIYIDPPYNTGNDFIYKDDFRLNEKENEIIEGDISDNGERLIVNQKSSNRFHANWLNMMYPRLKVAKDLLTEDGVIFISIDENEVHNLRKICDEVFGEDNFIGDLPRKTKSSTNDPDSNFNNQHDYILIYRKTSEFKLKGFIKNLSKYKNPDGDINGPWVSSDPSAKSGGDGTYFEIVNPYTGKKDLPPQGRYWAFNKDSFRNYVKEGKIKFKNQHKDNERGFIFKTYLKQLKSKYKPFDSLFFSENTYMNQNATKELNSFGFDFDYPKPTRLIYDLIKYSIDNDGIVLDFFSGSATTAHAVMQLNAEDGGNRKFIMVQLPEPTDEKSEAYKAGYKNICEIGKDRIRRAGEKVKKEYKDKEGIENLDIGFKVFRVADTNIRWTKEALKGGQLDLDESMLSDKDALDFIPGFTDIDVVYEVMLRQRDIPLSSKIEKLDYIGNRTYMFANSFVVSLEEKITENMVEALAAIEPLPIKYIFRDSAFEDDIELKDTTFRKLQALIERNTGEKKKTYTVEFI